MVDIIGSGSFFEENRGKMFYVGFVRSSKGAWFPLCMLSDPEEGGSFDAIYVSPALRVMSEVVETYKEEASGLDDSLVQFLMASEVSNLMERYGLSKVAVVTADSGCDCGCGCDS